LKCELAVREPRRSFVEIRLSVRRKFLRMPSLEINNPDVSRPTTAVAHLHRQSLAVERPRRHLGRPLLTHHMRDRSISGAVGVYQVHSQHPGGIAVGVGDALAIGRPRGVPRRGPSPGHDPWVRAIRLRDHYRRRRPGAHEVGDQLAVGGKHRTAPP